MNFDQVYSLTEQVPTTRTALRLCVIIRLFIDDAGRSIKWASACSILMGIDSCNQRGSGLSVMNARRDTVDESRRYKNRHTRLNCTGRCDVRRKLGVAGLLSLPPGAILPLVGASIHDSAGAKRKRARPRTQPCATQPAPP